MCLHDPIPLGEDMPARPRRSRALWRVHRSNRNSMIIIGQRGTAAADRVKFYVPLFHRCQTPIIAPLPPQH